ncbi:hypothetical protein [Flavobacterium sp.]|uniref:hypothetical protein n=1 Tax=Flavobacterium sp. TaxID=239 RepID=UPI003BEEDC9F
MNKYANKSCEKVFTEYKSMIDFPQNDPHAIEINAILQKIKNPLKNGEMKYFFVANILITLNMVEKSINISPTPNGIPGNLSLVKVENTIASGKRNKLVDSKKSINFFIRYCLA